MLRNIAIVTALLISLSGCVTPPAVPSEADARSIHSLAIISGLGIALNVQHTGFMVFGNSYTSLTPDWDVDGYVTRSARALLSPKYKIEPVTYDKAVFDEKNTFPPPSWLASLPASDADAFLVFVRARSQDPVLPSNQYVQGLGVYSASVYEVVHAYYTVYLVDAHTHKILAQDDSRTGKGQLFGDPHLPQIVRAHSWINGAGEPHKYPEKADQFTDANKRDLEAELKTLLDASLPYTLGQMGLAPQ